MISVRSKLEWNRANGGGARWTTCGKSLLASFSIALSSCYSVNYDALPSDAQTSAADATSQPSDVDGGLDSALGPLDAVLPEVDGDIDAASESDAESEDGSSDGEVSDAARDTAVDAAPDAEVVNTLTACAGLSSCTPVCPTQLGSCQLSCTNAGECGPTCAPATSCVITCRNTAKCNVTCSPGASCSLICDNSDCRGRLCALDALCTTLSCVNGALCP